MKDSLVKEKRPELTKCLFLCWGKNPLLLIELEWGKHGAYSGKPDRSVNYRFKACNLANTVNFNMDWNLERKNIPK